MKIQWKYVLGAVVAGASAATVAACTAGGAPGPSISSVNVGDPNYSHLQLAVGTANLYGTVTGLNVVSTLRQPNGRSAVGVDTPTLTGPFTFSAAATPAPASGQSDPYTTVFPQLSPTIAPAIIGPSLPETTAASVAITGTPQTVHPGTPYCDSTGSVPNLDFSVCPNGISPNASTFGESGGAFAMGLAPYNTVAAQGQSYSYAPYPQPMYENNHPQFIPWGGPPAFDPDGNGMGTRDGLVPLGFDSFGFPFWLGVGEGVTAFENVTPAVGTYQLSISIGIIGNGGPSFVTISKSAMLSSLSLLPTVTAPTVLPDANGDGGATFTATVPAPVTEALVQIVDFGPGGDPTNTSGPGPSNCQGPKGTAFAPVYYTVKITASGTYNLPPTDGPNTNLNGGSQNLTPSPSICTAAQNNASGNTNAYDTFTVQMIGFDYPDYEAAFSLTQQNTPQAPTITGPNGQSDITVSSMVEEVCSSSSSCTSTPLLRIRHGLRPLRRGVGPLPMGARPAWTGLR